MGKPKVPTIKPTAQEIQQFEINKDKWANYQQNGVPVQNEIIRRTLTDKLNPDGSVKTDAGQAMALAQKQWEPLLKQPVNPNSGAGRTGMLSMLQDKMGSDMRIESQTRYGQQTGYLGAMQDVINMGRGLESSNVQNLGNLTQLAARQAANDAQNTFNRRLENQTALGGLVGMGSTYLMNGVNTVAPDGSYIKGAYDNALKGWMGSLTGNNSIYQGDKTYQLNTTQPTSPHSYLSALQGVY